MERIDLALSEFSRRSRSLAVSHAASALSRGLDLGEYVVVHDHAAGPAGADYTAIVADVHFELEDTVYRLELGTRITPEEAAEWLAPATEDGPITTSRLAGLLGELRSRERALQEFLGEMTGR